MIADNALRLADAEVTPNNGNATGTVGSLGAASVALGLDEIGLTTQLRSFRDVGAGETMSLAFNVDTAFTCGTFNAALQIQLVSLPIVATALANAAGTGKQLRLSGIPTDIADADPKLADTFTLAGHELPFGAPVFLDSIVTTTGLTQLTIYYVIPTTADQFQVAASLADALANPAVPIDMTGGDGTAGINFIPTVHASTGSLQLFDVGVPTHQGPLRLGSRFNVPLRSMASLTTKGRSTDGQVRQTVGAGPTSGLIAANAQRFYYLNYIPSATIVTGAITCDLVMTPGNALNYLPTGTEMV